MILAIMPVRGRTAQTVEAMRRLHATAGDVSWALVCVGGSDERETLLACEAAGAAVLHDERPRLTYWQALALATERTPTATFLANLANDLLPGSQWLARCAAAYNLAFGTRNDAMMGFNGDSHGPDHSCHFLIGRKLLADLGGWPTHYDHNFGDTELCLRAASLGRYRKAPYALLFHDHPWMSAAPDDATYAEGRARWDRDQALFESRRARGWA